MAVPIIRNVILQAGISPSTKHVPFAVISCWKRFSAAGRSCTTAAILSVQTAAPKKSGLKKVSAKAALAKTEGTAEKQ